MDLFRRFKQDATLLVSPPPNSEWDWVFIMQHHGVPTRLLDWTENPLVALWFVVYQHPTDDGALWELDPVGLNRESNLSPEYEKEIPGFEDSTLDNYKPTALAKEKTSSLFPVAAIAPRNTSRMQAQLGTFIIYHRNRLPLESLGQAKHVRKLIVPKGRKRAIFKQLSLLGINKLRLFPELQNIGEALRKDLS